MNKFEQNNNASFILKNVKIILSDQIISNGSLVIRDGKIARVSDKEEDSAGFPEIDGRGFYAAPGFIDIHCHGDGRRSIFHEGNPVAAALSKNGTTGVLATLGYPDIETGKLHNQIEKYWNERDEIARRVILGIHLEGPYTNPKYGACTNLGKVHAPDPKEYEPVLAQWSKVVRLWTFAPEITGAIAFADAAFAKGVILSAGHTEASADQLRELMDKGLRVATHWTNASGAPPTHFAGTREPGIDEFALADARIMAEVISDAKGCHVRPLMQQLLYRTKGPDEIILITDASYSSENIISNEEEDVNYTAEGELCGSRLSMPVAARNFRKQVKCSLPELFRMGSLNAARLFDWDAQMGSLEEGKIANILLIDEAINVRRVWLHGRDVTLAEDMNFQKTTPFKTVESTD